MTPLGTWLLGDGRLGDDYDLDERAEALQPWDDGPAVVQPSTAAAVGAVSSDALIDSEDSEATHP